MVSPARDELVLALPSKGSLHQGALDLFRDAGMGVSWDSGRTYIGSLSHPAGVKVLFLRAEEILLKVADGTAHVGITGRDLYEEKAPDPRKTPILAPQLGFGRARLVVAVPEEWLDIASVADLTRLFSRFRERHHRAIQIATKFTNLTRGFFTTRHGTRDYALVLSLGATEAAPASGVADCIVDLTSSGTTLRENRLKEIDGGTVLESEACLITNAQSATWSPERRRIMGRVLDALESAIEAKKYHLVSFGAEQPQGIAYFREKARAYGATILRHEENSLDLLVPRPRLDDLVAALRERRCTPVAVTKPRGVFFQESRLQRDFDALLQPE